MEPEWEDEEETKRRYPAAVIFLFGLNVVVSMMIIFILAFLMLNRDTLLQIMQFPTRTELEKIEQKYDESRLSGIEKQLDKANADLKILEQTSGDVGAENLKNTEEFQTAITNLKQRLSGVETNLKTAQGDVDNLQSWQQTAKPSIEELEAFQNGTCLWAEGGDTGSERREFANYACDQ